jgi:hypothetical protein
LKHSVILETILPVHLFGYAWTNILCLCFASESCRLIFCGLFGRLLDPSYYSPELQEFLFVRKTNLVLNLSLCYAWVGVWTPRKIQLLQSLIGVWNCSCGNNLRCSNSDWCMEYKMLGVGSCTNILSIFFPFYPSNSTLSVAGLIMVKTTCVEYMFLCWLEFISFIVTQKWLHVLIIWLACSEYPCSDPCLNRMNILIWEDYEEREIKSQQGLGDMGGIHPIPPCIDYPSGLDPLEPNKASLISAPEKNNPTVWEPKITGPSHPRPLPEVAAPDLLGPDGGGLLSTYRKMDKQANYKAYKAQNSPPNILKSQKNPHTLTFFY